VDNPLRSDVTWTFGRANIRSFTTRNIGRFTSLTYGKFASAFRR